MAHELDFNEHTGRHSFISRIQTAWHRLGIVFNGEMDLDSALRLAGLDWRVKKVPNYIKREDVAPWQLANPAEAFKRSGDSFSIVRQDRQEVIGTVGANYHPLQQEDAFGVLRPVLDTGLATIETAGSLRGGKQVWMMVRFEVERIVKEAIAKGGDPELLGVLVGETLPYGLFTNDHTGSAKARIQETAVRVVCANTFNMAITGKQDGTVVEIVHGRNVVEAYEASANLLLAGVGKRFAALATARQRMKETILMDHRGWGERPFQRLVLDEVAPVAHLEAKIQRRDSNPRTLAALTRASETRATIRHLWENGKGHEADGSAWEALQGVVEFLDHSEGAVRGQDPSGEKRAAALYDGNIGRVKSRIARNLFAYATADEDHREAMVFGKQ